MWTYEALAEADRALGVADPVQAAAALNAQTATTHVDVPTAEARQVLLLSGEWSAIKLLAKATHSGTSPPSAQDQAIMAADLCIDTLTLTETLHVGDDAHWTKVQTMIAGLHAAGVLSSASIAAWTALRTQTLPVWNPPPSDQDILHARSLA